VTSEGEGKIFLFKRNGALNADRPSGGTLGGGADDLWMIARLIRACSPPCVRRQQLCTGKCAGSDDLSDRLLLRWILRADGIRAGANHAEGLRLQVPLRAGNEGGGKGDDRQEPGEQDGTEDGGGLLQKER